MKDLDGALAEFDRALSAANEAAQPFDALRALTESTVGAKLFTIMTVDMEQGIARRSYTSHPEDYPVSGTKPIRYDRWFSQVHKERSCFVANTLAEIDEVFPDAELIGRLGCGSVINLPVVLGDNLVCTVNMLHAEGYYTPERVERARRCLSLPAKAAYLAARWLEAPQ